VGRKVKGERGRVNQVLVKRAVFGYPIEKGVANIFVGNRDSNGEWGKRVIVELIARAHVSKKKEKTKRRRRGLEDQR